MRVLTSLSMLLCLAISGPLTAQTVTIGNAQVQLGMTTAVVPVSFTPGATAVSGYQVRFSFSRGLPVGSGNVVVVPGDGSCTGTGISDPNGTQITVSDSGSGALAAGTTCTLNFPVQISSPLGFYPFTVEFSEFTAATGGTVTGNVIAGGITIFDGGPAFNPPVLGYAPAPGNEVSFQGPAGQTLVSSILVSGTGGAGTGATATARVSNCRVTPVSNPAAFSCSPDAGSSLDFLPGFDPGDIECACLVQPGGSALATLSCDEIRPLSSGQPVTRSWALNCTADAVIGIVPVDTLSTGGRILLAALLLLLGVPALARISQ